MSGQLNNNTHIHNMLSPNEAPPSQSPLRPSTPGITSSNTSSPSHIFGNLSRRVPSNQNAQRNNTLPASNAPSGISAEDLKKLAREGRLGELEDLANAGVNFKIILKVILNEANEEGNTAAHYAAEQGALKALTFLGEYGAIHAKNSKGETPLSIAINNKHEVAKDYLLSKGAISPVHQLLEAAQTGNLETLKELEKAGVNLNTADKEGNTAAHYAAEKGDLKTLIFLGKHNAIHAKNSKGETPLSVAINKNRKAAKDYLLRKGAVSPVHQLLEAAQTGDLETLKKLANAGVNLNAADKEGNTAAHYAAENKNIATLFFLGKNNAIHAKNLNNETPLDVAIKNGHGQIESYLLQKGVSSLIHKVRQAAQTGDLETLKKLEAEGVDLNIADGKGNTAAHHAVLNEKTEVLRFLCEKNAIHVKNINGETPLDTAIKLNNQSAEFDLLKNGATTFKFTLGYSISRAVLRGDLIFIESYPGDVNVLNANGNNPLQVAMSEAGGSNLDVIKLLIKKGIDVNKPFNDLEKSRPLYVAVQNGNEELVKCLIKAGAKRTSFNEKGSMESAICAAIKTENTRMMDILLENNIGDIDIGDNMGRSPLCIAIQLGKAGAVEYLVQNTADIYLELYGSTFFEIAEKCVLNNPRAENRIWIRNFLNERKDLPPYEPHPAYSESNNSILSRIGR